jgi:uncharacterized repeat protein (TIGR03803 family)
MIARSVGLFLGAALLGASGASAGPLSIVHSFTGFPADGSRPSYATPVLSGSTLYGTTRFGGGSDLGTIYKVNTDGSGFSLLHSFVTPDGREPFGGLTLSGSKLYGMTFFGGASGLGAVFTIDTSGTGFSVLHSFFGGASDGRTPYGTLTVSGSTLYGMTYSGGASNLGTVFKMNTDGSGFSLLHTFTGGTSDGRNPYGGVTLIGSTLYGTTFGGGTGGNLGTVFKVDTDGSNFGLLHSFTGAGTDGSLPQGDLTAFGSTLYGMTPLGGAHAQGALFKIQTDGSGFDLLHSFSVSATDGQNPSGAVIINGSTLYGMTRLGGSATRGSVFSIGVDGSNFSLLHSFTGGATGGDGPYAGLIRDGSTLYGMTEFGGTANLGVVFSTPIPEPATILLVVTALATSILTRRWPRRQRVAHE